MLGKRNLLPLPRKKFFNFKGLLMPCKIKKAFLSLSQSGRSMLEMLCVLGVIGVLSLVSFAAIRSGLSKAQANKISYSVNLQANSLLMTLDAEKLPVNDNGDLTLSYTKTENGYAITGTSEFEDSFELKVSGVPKDVCRQVENTIPENAFAVLINESTSENKIPVGGQVKVGGTCTDEENTITYFFTSLSVSKEDALSDYLCAELDEECGQCQACRNGQCELVPAETIDPSGTCSGTTPACSATGACICSSNSCGENRACNTNTGACIDCPTVDNPIQLSQTLCNMCNSTFYMSNLTTSSGGYAGEKCYSCDTEENPTLWQGGGSSNCGSRCENRFLSDKTCYKLKCPTADTPTKTTKTFCDNDCDNAFWISGVTTTSGGFGGDSWCYSCSSADEPKLWTGRTSDCQTECITPGSKRILANSQCFKMTCPTADTPTRATKTFCDDDCDNAFWMGGLAKPDNSYGGDNWCYSCASADEPKLWTGRTSDCQTKCTTPGSGRVLTGNICKINTTNN